MKKLSLLFVCILTIVSCDKDILEEEVSINETVQNPEVYAKKGNKVAVCHKNGEIIFVNKNAIKAHIGHGDAVDMDGDGYFDRENSCSIGGVDCDDTNAEINPDAEEIVYNGVDDDCNPATLDDDLDEDGFINADDCDDTDAALNPELDSEGYSTCNPKPESTGYFPSDFDFKSLLGEYKAEILEGEYEGMIVKFSITRVNDSYINNDRLYCNAELQHVTVGHGGIRFDPYMYGAYCIINTSNGVLTFNGSFYGGVLDNSSTTISITEGITNLSSPYYDFAVTK